MKPARGLEVGYPWDRVEGGMYLQVDLYEVGDEVIVEAEVPGIAPTDIELEVSSDCVRIGGRRTRRCRTISPDIPMRSVRRERSLGDFCREIPLPLPVLRDTAHATLCNGVLTIRMLKRRPTATARRLPIKLVEPHEGRVEALPIAVGS
jgi:HSP20 family protein